MIELYHTNNLIFEANFAPNCWQDLHLATTWPHHHAVSSSLFLFPAAPFPPLSLSVSLPHTLLLLPTILPTILPSFDLDYNMPTSIGRWSNPLTLLCASHTTLSFFLKVQLSWHANFCQIRNHACLDCSVGFVSFCGVTVTRYLFAEECGRWVWLYAQFRSTSNPQLNIKQSFFATFTFPTAPPLFYPCHFAAPSITPNSHAVSVKVRSTSTIACLATSSTP